MANATVPQHAAEGFEPPLFRTYSNKLGMWLFIISDSLTFGALLFAYSYGRISNPDWPTPFDAPSILLSSIMTLFLLSSSLTMVLAVLAAQRRDRSWTMRWIGATMGFGTGFIILHAYEWYSLITKAGVTPTANPWDVPLFGGTFFALTGLHMLHVTIGVIVLGVILWRCRGPKFSDQDVEVSGLYWHFVDLVWMFIFPLVYLMSTNI
jgi:cytochrome c oxidase subunit III